MGLGHRQRRNRRQLLVGNCNEVLEQQPVGGRRNHAARVVDDRSGEPGMNVEVKAEHSVDVGLMRELCSEVLAHRCLEAPAVVLGGTQFTAEAAEEGTKPGVDPIHDQPRSRGSRGVEGHLEAKRDGFRPGRVRDQAHRVLQVSRTEGPSVVVNLHGIDKRRLEGTTLR